MWKSFRRVAQLQRTDTRQKPFDQKAHFREYQTTHTEGQTLECGKNYSYNSAINMQLRTHTVELCCDNNTGKEPFVLSEPSVDIRELMEGMNVKNPSLGDHPSLCIKEPTQVRKFMNAMNVGQGFPRNCPSLYIREFTQERNPINVLNVVKSYTWKPSLRVH